MSEARDYYKILQVDPDADADVVTAAFRALARRLHPDRDYTGIDEYRMAELNRAYAVLRDPQKRRQYDAERSLLQPMGPGYASAPVASGSRQGGLAARVTARQDAAAEAAHRPVPMGATATESAEPARLQFGRYAGMTLREVASTDVDYLRWLSRHSSGLRYRREIERILKVISPDDYPSRSSM